MREDSFFDTNVIINYASFSKKVNLKINRICFDYIKSKNGKYILCRYVEDEIKNRIKKRKVVHQEVISKLKDNSYEIGNSDISKSLSDRDIIYAKKLYELYKSEKADDISFIFLSERAEFEKKIEFFLKTQVDELLLKKEEIEVDLIHILFSLIDEYADCKVLASALQIQKDRPVFFLVTVDKEHFYPNGYAFIKDDLRLKSYKFPELRNLLINNI